MSDKIHITFERETKNFKRSDADAAIAELGWTGQVSCSFIFEAKELMKKYNIPSTPNYQANLRLLSR